MAMMGGVMSIVGGLVQAKGAMDQAEAEAKAHEYNAAVDVRNKEVIDQQVGAAIKAKSLSDIRQITALRARYSAVGVSMTGSASDVMVDAIAEQAYGSRLIWYQGEIQKVQLTDDMNLELMGAENARQAGKVSAAAAILNGFTSAMGSFGSMMS